MDFTNSTFLVHVKKKELNLPFNIIMKLDVKIGADSTHKLINRKLHEAVSYFLKRQCFMIYILFSNYFLPSHKQFFPCNFEEAHISLNYNIYYILLKNMLNPLCLFRIFLENHVFTFLSFIFL